MATKAEVEAHENNLRRDIEALRLEMIPDRSVLLVCARRY